MSQYNSFMFSDAVYLFGNTFASAPSWGDSEELPNGTKVSQKNLAKQVVLAAFAYLYKKQLIDFDLGERKFLFIRNKTIYVKTRQSSAPDLSGLEAVIFSTLREESNMYHITRRAVITRMPIPWFSPNPWGWVLDIVKENLMQRGIVKRDVRQGLFIGDLSQAEKQITELKKTLKELQSKGELYQQILSDIHCGIASRESRGD